MWPGKAGPTPLWPRLGAYGVDLFFVISGWLIGGLFWREAARFGEVEVRRFIVRRVLRTMPPYFVALALYSVAAGMFSAPPPILNWHYLCFVQNYGVVIPSFVVSWSLCVEEHFYLFFPLATAALLASGTGRAFRFAALLSLAPLAGRLCFMGESEGFFGYYWTASHLRAEGLILGVWASYLFVNEPLLWTRLQAVCRLAAWPLILGAAALLLYLPPWGYSVGVFLLSWGFMMLVVNAVSSPASKAASTRVNYLIAITSYSTYLVHPLAIHVAKALHPQGGLPLALLMLLGVAAASGVFFFAVEVPSLRLRDALAPRRCD